MGPLPGKRREYEAVGLLKARGNRFRRVRVADGSELAGGTLSGLRTRNTYGVAVLLVERAGERIVAPTGGTELRAGDALIAVGAPGALDAFQEAAG